MKGISMLTRNDDLQSWIAEMPLKAKDLSTFSNFSLADNQQTPFRVPTGFATAWLTLSIALLTWHCR